MNLNLTQLRLLQRDLQYIIGREVNYQEECVTVHFIEIDPNRLSLRLLLREGFPMNVQLYMGFDQFIKFNPEYAHHLLL